MHPKLIKLPKWSAPAFAAGRPGHAIIEDLPESLYHGTKSIVSKSALETLLSESPFHYYHFLDHPDPDRDADALRIGGAYHVAVLEPDLYAAKVIIMPIEEFGPMQSSKNRAIRDHWIQHEAHDKGLIYLYPDEHRQVIGMRDVLLSFPWARKMLSQGGRPEVTALWTCNETGLRCKSRADWIHADRGVFVDLKSAVSAKPTKWRRAARDHNYDMQDAMYSRAFEENGIHIEHFWFLVQEKTPPYAPAAYQLTDTDRLRGEDMYMKGLRKLRKCIDEDHWPSYTDGVEDLLLPNEYTGLQEAA